METHLFNADDEKGLIMAARALKNGELVAFPTETVYGLGANALDPSAVKKIFEAKGRPSDNPLIVHISDQSQLKDLVRDIPHNAQVLMDSFWPGPLTLVFRKTSLVPDIISAGLDTVAVRMPQNTTALRLIEESGVPVAAPSANISGRPSPTNARHVLEDMGGRIGYILDGGSCPVGVESTVLDMTAPVPLILRPGGITLEMLLTVLERVEIDRALELKGDKKPRSPGMKYRHYSPRAEMVLVRGPSANVIQRINKLAHEHRNEGKTVGVLSCLENMDKYKADLVISLGSAENPGEIAAGLFETLRKFDETNVDIIYSEAFSEKGIGQAIMNRLKKAASGKIIEV